MILLGLLGLLVFVLLSNRFFPFGAANLNTGKSEAIQTAAQFLESKGYNLDGYIIDTMYGYNSNAFTYFHRKHGWEKTEQAFRKGRRQGLTFFWRPAIFPLMDSRKTLSTQKNTPNVPGIFSIGPALSPVTMAK